MRILIQKFGGTSVSTKEIREKAIEKISNAINQGYSPVIVVSAMGRRGQPYATDSLLSLVDEHIGEKSPRSLDLLLNCGEIISSVVFSSEMIENGMAAIPLTGGQAGIETDNKYNNACVLNINTDRLIKLLLEKKIPVVAGFQGCDQHGYLTTLGRGGSDVTASLLGAYLKAEKVEIYTDVDGIMTADPRLVPDATLINQISYDEVFQLADQGAKVIHPKAVNIAMRANIPLVIKNTLSECDGTIISRESSKERIITGITHMGDRIQIRIKENDNLNNSNYSLLLEELALTHISIDLINVFPEENIFTIDKSDFEIFSKMMGKLNLLFTHIDNCSKIAIIGSGMRGIPGIMAKIFKAITKENIRILQSADSHTTIWVLVEDNSVKTAINSLHKEFDLG